MGDAVAFVQAQRQIHRALLAAASPLTHFVTRVMLIRHWPHRGKSALPGFLFRYQAWWLVVAQLRCLWLALASLALFEPIAVAVHFQDVDVVGQPIEQSAGQPLGPETPVHSSNGRLEVTMVEPRS